MPPPKSRHYAIQQRLLNLLRGAAGDTGLVGTEFGFVIAAENYRIADVVYVTAGRWAAVDPNSYFCGAPDLAIEILSPSNTDAEMREKRTLCLANGSREFWVVDAGAREVEVFTSDGRWTVYKSGQPIPLFFAPGSTLAVDAIFED